MNDIGVELIKVLIRHGEALVRLAQARLELLVFGWDRTIRRAHRRSSMVADENPVDGTDPEIIIGSDRRRDNQDHWDRLNKLEAPLHRMSRLVPGATCIHRALAVQRMLLRRHTPATIVIGLRRGVDRLEGHAWVEAVAQGQRRQFFVGEQAGYRPVL